MSKEHIRKSINRGALHLGALVEWPDSTIDVPLSKHEAWRIVHDLCEMNRSEGDRAITAARGYIVDRLLKLLAREA